MLIPMAAGGTLASDAFSLVMGAVDDQVVAYSEAQEGYAQTPGDKLLLGLKNAGHLAFSDLCAMGRERGGLIAILQETGVSLPEAAGDLIVRLGTDGCAESQMTPERGWQIINAVSGSHLRARLQCRGQGMSAQEISYHPVSGQIVIRWKHILSFQNVRQTPQFFTQSTHNLISRP